MSSIIAIIVLVAVVGGFLTFKNMNRKKTASAAPPSPAEPTSTEESPKDQLKKILDSLVQLNLLIRKDAGISNELTLEIEAIIDDLATIIPAMMERYPGETLTYEIKKIGKEHLYRTVKEYLDLSDDSRTNQADIFKKTIESLHEVSKRSRDIVEKNETAEFKTMANFLAGKF